MSLSVRVFAPATASNLGPGFDVLGLALNRPGDIVEAAWSESPGIQIAEVTGDDGLLTTDPTQNVAGVAAQSVLDHLVSTSPSLAQAPGVTLRVRKHMPLASGLGSSAASSVAGAFAVNELFGAPLTKRELLEHALAGERAASGAAHADNAAASLLGGITLVAGYDPLTVLQLPVPKRLRVAVVHPRYHLETVKARAMLRGYGFPIELAVANLGSLGAFVAALYQDDLELLGRAVEDRLVEPLRTALIPGLKDVKEAARKAGAIGCSISGSGPSVFAFADSDAVADRVALAMRDAFREKAQVDGDTFVGAVNETGAVRLAD